MEALDTNVVVRLLVQDDEDQCQRAYKFDRSATASALHRLAKTEGVVIEDGPEIDRALSRFETGAADFSDYVIFGAAERADALPLWTFGDKLSRTDGVKQVP